MANILIIATGGTRAPTMFDLGERFLADGHEIRFVASGNALRFLTGHLFRNPRRLGLFFRHYRPALRELLAYFPEKPKAVPHLAEGKWADVVVVAPATCNSVGKLVAGLADNFPLQILRGVARGKKVVVVPSMNPEMWFDPPLQRNIDILNSVEKYRVLCPSRGRMLTGDWGIGAQSPFEDIVSEVYRCIGIVDDSVSAVLEGRVGQVPWREAAGADGAPAERFRVLLVDSEAAIRSALAAAIERTYPRYDVKQYASASEMLAEIDQGPIHLLLSELDAGGGASGHDAIEAVQVRYGKEVPIIAVGHKSRQEARAEELARNEVMYLPKPLNVEFVVGMIGGCIEGQAGKRSTSEMRRVSLKPGEKLFEQDDEGEQVFVVVSGRLGVDKRMDGEIVRVATVGPKEMLGEMALLGDSKRSATVTAIEPSDLVELNLDHVKDYLEAQPGWLRSLIDSLIEHLKRAGPAAPGPTTLRGDGETSA